jgi:tRNA(Ile)-lysidine synthetase-like protein
MTTLIRTTWLSHPEYWFATGSQKEVDRLLYDTFRTYNASGEDTLGQILYLDQLVRHFSRVEPISEEVIEDCRIAASYLVESLGPAFLNAVSQEELVWYLMPWKHLGQYGPVFQQIQSWLSTRKRPLTEFPLLNRFFMDSYRKAYATVTPTLSVNAGPYDPIVLCESHPPTYTGCSSTWKSLCIPASAKPLLEALPSKGAVTISLSGGVDSMLMAALLVRKGLDVIAAHIVYGNRAESEGEANFVATYCQKLGIPLHVYRVEWLRRDSVDRAFYEEMTRSLRFSVYKALGSERSVYLGHIQEDAVENVWTNFAHGSHLDNLIKFQAVAVEDSVTICRPWLSICKQTIYEIADALAIPHLKNTTPSWSNRGKFRNSFYAATHEQYGPSVDAKVLEVAGRLRSQATLLDRLLYQPILDTWTVDKQLNVTLAVQNDLGPEGWDHLLTQVAHTHLGIPKPRFAATSDFVTRLRRSKAVTVSLRKDFVVTVLLKGGDTWLVFDNP